MKKTKFIKISTAERIPDPGIHIVIDHEGQLLLSRFNKYSTEEWFKTNYEYWLLEVDDIEEELKETLKETCTELGKAITKLSLTIHKVEKFQEQINEIRNNK